ncbi:MAG: hypothetical protein IJF10_00235, partial [Clostridia bacterium]|nr:hypothetical protein [Clostridia bacterium]
VDTGPYVFIKAFTKISPYIDLQRIHIVSFHMATNKDSFVKRELSAVPTEGWCTQTRQGVATEWQFG